MPSPSLPIAAGALAAAALVAAQLAQPRATAQPQLPPEAAAALAAQQQQGRGDKKDDFQPFDEVIKDYTKVVSTADGANPLYTLYIRQKDGQLLAELPREFERQKLFIALTVAGGEPTAGIQFGDLYAYWKRIDKRLALIQPNMETRTSDPEFARSRDNLFTDRVILDIPILAMSPNGGPVVDLDELLVGQAEKFYGPMVRGANRPLTTIEKAKAFPENIELAFKMPFRDGSLTTLYYSWSRLPENTGYTPRKADPRVGFFTTAYNDLGDPSSDQPWTRYVNRWKLEKADPKLRLSPPKEPIVWYIEHTTPVRYRRWVREGVEMWNEAFEAIGIRDAIEVYQQDATTGAHMDKDPEDVRYNFVRWNTNQASFAIGPSRVDPRTGQILDADVVMNDGLIRWFAGNWRDLASEIALEGFAPETMEWLDQNPKWDPRVRLAAPADQQRMIQQRAAARAAAAAGMGEQDHTHPAAHHHSHLLGDERYDGLKNRLSQVNGFCRVGECAAMNISLFRLTMEASLAAQTPATPVSPTTPEPAPGEDLLDGAPESFVGGFLRYVTAHEVGHCIGLRHNFKSSTIHSLADLNASADFGGNPTFGSVMEYAGANINMKDGPVQGPWVTGRVGPYDIWAIRFGYGDEQTSKEALKEAGKPEHIYGTDEDSWGPDPRARVWDMGSDPIAFAESRMRLIQDLRPKIIENMVKDGEGWSKARRAYQVLLANHMTAVSIAANWVGGSFINRDRKGDPAGRPPIENIPAQTQRRALDFVIRNAFQDDAFGLSPELLQKMTVDKWWDMGGMDSIFSDETWDVHDRIVGIQASALTMLMNPTRLRRIYDNEFRVPSSEDTITLPEVLFGVTDAIFTELSADTGRTYTARQPMVSSLRRNLQREQIERLIDLTLPNGFFGAARKPVANLASFKLRELKTKLESALKNASRLDPYTLAHFQEAALRIEKALDADYIYNADQIGGGGSVIFIGGASQPDAAEPRRP